jgi:hypothetical protein
MRAIPRGEPTDAPLRSRGVHADLVYVADDSKKKTGEAETV